MIKLLLRLLFLLGTTFNITLLGMFIRSWLPNDFDMGFDAIANALGWLMGGAAIGIIISIFLIRQLTEAQLKKGTIITLVIAVSCFFILNYQIQRRKNTQPPTQEEPARQPTAPRDAR
ncbi:MAG: hypothetical protein AAGG75_01635 [Bacteroidota bacterium]